MISRVILFCVATFLIGFCLLASATNFPSSGKGKKAKRDSIKNHKIAVGKTIVSPVGAPVYAPEFGFMVAGGAIISFRTKKSDTSLQRSFLPATVGMSNTGALIFQSSLTSFWKKNKIQINGAFILRLMPDHYWGVGYKKAQTTHRSDTTSAYTKKWLLINPEVNWQFRKNMFLGIGLDINNTTMSELTQQQNSDPNIIHFGTQNNNNGLGVILKFDSRDVPVNAYKGTLLQLNAYYYGDYLKSDNEYSYLQLDFRKYIPLFGKAKTLTLQLKSRVSLGSVPYGEMSMVGSPFDLRGYYWGQYRDRNMIFGIVEWRHKFNKIKSKELSKIGAVLWVGTGSVSPTLKEFTYWMPNAGIGVRYELQPRLNLRLDYGVGYNSTGFYFNFSEAF